MPSINQICQSIDPSIHPINQSMHQRIDWSIHQSVDQSIDQFISISDNQSIKTDRPKSFHQESFLILSVSTSPPAFLFVSASTAFLYSSDPRSPSTSHCPPSTQPIRFPGLNSAVGKAVANHTSMFEVQLPAQMWERTGTWNILSLMLPYSGVRSNLYL